jgi:leucine dehydrogenase
MNSIFEKMKAYDCEELHFRYDPGTGLRAVIALHSTRRGEVTSGGVRMMDYPDEEAVLREVLNLSRAMTYKCAAIAAELGGSKAVLWNKPEQKKPAFLKVFGKFVKDLGGRYRTAVDYGLTHEDGEIIRSVCPYIEGESQDRQRFEPEAAVTARGVVEAMKIAVAYCLRLDSLGGLTVAVQGVGYVGRYLVDFLLREGVRVIAADIDSGIIATLRREYPAVQVVPAADLLSRECDILAPCALGEVLNPGTIPQLKCRIICGAANNQLKDPERDILLLKSRDILYLPDFIVNAGGIIQGIAEMKGEGREQVNKGLEIIKANTRCILERYRQSYPHKTTWDIALQLVNERLAVVPGQPAGQDPDPGVKNE